LHSVWRFNRARPTNGSGRGSLRDHDLTLIVGMLELPSWRSDPVAWRGHLHLGEPTAPPTLMPTRGPPLWEMPGGELGEIDPQAQSAPEYEFDQRITW
jgi:hypothetical protein